MGARCDVPQKCEETNVELDVSQEIGQILDEFATRFGATGAELWAELVRYEVTSAIVSMIIAPVTLLVAFYAMRKLWTMSQRSDEVFDNELWVIGSVASGIVCIVFVVVTLVSAFDLVVTLAAPQAATLKGLLP